MEVGRAFAAAAGAVLGGRPARKGAVRALLAVPLAKPVGDLLVRMVCRAPGAGSGHSAAAGALAVASAGSTPRAVTFAAAAVAGAGLGKRALSAEHGAREAGAGAAAGLLCGYAARRLWRPSGADHPAATGPVRYPSPGTQGAGVAVVVSPGARRSRRAAEAVRAALPEAELRFPGAGASLPEVREVAARGAQALAVAGGDGSVAAGAAAARRHRVPLPAVPAGTFDDFARSLGPATPEQALRGHRAGTAALVRVAPATDSAQDRGVLNTLGFGAYRRLVEHRRSRERLWGKWPAALAGLASVLRHRPETVRVDGVPHRVWPGFVGVGRYRSHGLTPAHRERLDEGVLDVRLLTAPAPEERGDGSRLRALWGALAGPYGGPSRYLAWTAETLTLQPEEDRPLIVDGEPVTPGGPVTITAGDTEITVFRPA
ncbi:diacylglycerol kinase family protein [Streptomyces sp. ODS28]|uniref:diacylglycerol/lipid kinase family protein n=1 Tax=Streptomyces sp. ODS28 TaxID=3136688 RepID=UPI0031E68D81